MPHAVRHGDTPAVHQLCVALSQLRSQGVMGPRQRHACGASEESRARAYALAAGRFLLFASEPVTAGERLGISSRPVRRAWTARAIAQP